MTPQHLQELESIARMLAADGELVTQRLDHWVATTPDKVFFHYGEDDVSYSYRAFGQLTDAIAGNLAAHGVTPGDRVSVFTTNSLMASLVMFAVWKAGAVYAPVNFSFSGRLLTYQLEDTAPRVLITDPGLLPAVNAVAVNLKNHPTVVLYVPAPGQHDHVAQEAAVDSRFPVLEWSALTVDSKRPEVSISLETPANIVYTSGTTGPSKGVLQPHRWMAGYTYNLRLPLTQDDVIYNDLPLYHVGGAIANVARAAWVGCEVAVWDRFSPKAFWSRVASRHVTTAILLDVMIPWLMKEPQGADDRSNTLNKVHMQPLPLHHHEVAKRFGIDLVTAGFGQTESGAPLGIFIEELAQGEGTPPALYRGLSHQEIALRVRESGGTLLTGPQVVRKGVMGTPVAFMEAMVLDPQDKPCEVGQPGELALRPKLPHLVLSEYIGKPEATVKAWRNLWFHTGDAAVLQPDGMFDFVDRLGDRIRVRGENLSSFQVEDLINQHPKVQMSAVLSVPSAEGDEDAIAAFVLPVEGEDLEEAQLRQFADTSMPKYMRPTHIRIVAEIPRTPTNKVEKYKLRAQLIAQIQSEAKQT